MQSVHIYGAGFVGITLAGHFLRVSKYEVFLVEKEVGVIEKIRNGNIPVYEPGLKQLIHDGIVSGRLHLQSLDEVTSVYIAFICISTPKNVVQNPIISLAQELVPVLAPGASIFIRSTCVIGSSQELSNILERLNRDDVDVYNAPERTAEGVAMQELIELPQLLGARDSSSLSKGSGILQDLGFGVIVSGSWSEVEMAKLLCNVWRDYSFAFANEAALLGERHFIDVLKVISIANYKYKRAGIPQPGPVGGPCLSKDTYLLVNQEVLSNSLFLHSRELNEHYLEAIVGEILSFAKEGAFSRILLAGIAFKGQPPTNDFRNSLGMSLLESLPKIFPSIEIAYWDELIDLPDYKRVFSLERFLSNQSKTLIIICNYNPKFVQNLESLSNLLLDSNQLFQIFDAAANISKAPLTQVSRVFGAPRGISC